MTRRVSAACAAVALLLVLPFVNTHVRGDGNGYFSWIASAVVDGDLDFRNQYEHANLLFADRYFDASGAPRPELITPTGRLDNQWATGPAVLWAPWFLTAHVIVRVTGTSAEDGFASAYRQACAIGSFCYAVCGLWLSALSARRFGVSLPVAAAAAVTVFGASSLLVYTFVLPFHVHALAAFTVALFLWYRITRGVDLTPLQWAIWGALAGLMCMTYYVDAVFALLALPAAVEAARRRGGRASIAGVGIFTAAALLAALPQWIGKAVVYGSPVVTGYQDAFHWWAPELWQTAFSTEHGVILWTPLVGVGIVGCAMVARQRLDMVWMLATAALFYVVIASYSSWHGLSSFGNRFFVSWTPLLVIGVGVIGQGMWQRRGMWRVWAVSCAVALMAWNAGLAVQWATKMMPSRGPVDVRMVVAQQWAVPGRVGQLLRRYVTDRANLAAEIEEQDRREWHEYRQRQ
ncbi:MAG: hypothetical protein KA154_15565 [Gemmatimonadaceae bacterium]|nr:hypothetical protein [Gemmatimonadaceae bacterium]